MLNQVRAVCMVQYLELCPDGVHSGAERVGVPWGVRWWRGRTGAPTALPLLIPHGRKRLHHAFVRSHILQLVSHQLHHSLRIPHHSLLLAQPSHPVHFLLLCSLSSPSLHVQRQSAGCPQQQQQRMACSLKVPTSLRFRTCSTQASTSSSQQLLFSRVLNTMPLVTGGTIHSVGMLRDVHHLS